MVLNRGTATARATTYLTGLGYPQPVVTVSADGLTVNVASRSTVETKMLSLIGIRDFDITATASASAVTGIG
ncbi:hypothetical protein GCM10025868_35360 [Angustibacter aerolatus]|uniref:LytR/CpsA/Psr regulator C-terminal domain-containing protein n=1 Tax=Angustibacter aerolatus TaxID=1162965 RepID=A0ABQ6JJ55_9ACTN|nr:hypothetical protein [Angustibacter aerolatus]GMA88286.1 hypothetical protein GCM10025868_35360 [Angustibacter aerolatus]